MSVMLCGNCKYQYLDSTNGPCVGCFLVDGHPHWKPNNVEEETPVTDDKNISMIKSIIDEAMEKRDRIVTINISGENVNISVMPLCEIAALNLESETYHNCKTE